MNHLNRYLNAHGLLPGNVFLDGADDIALEGRVLEQEIQPTTVIELLHVTKQFSNITGAAALSANLC